MSNKPNILFLTQRVPYPPNRGDRIRSWHMLRFIAERANVHLACMTEEAVEPETQTVLNNLCERVHIQPLSRIGRWARGAASVATGGSATQGLFASRDMRRVVEGWSREIDFDTVFTFCSSMFQFARLGPLKHARQVVDLVDVDSEKWSNYAATAPVWKRPLYRLESRRVRQLERTITRTADAVALVSEQEAALLRRFCNTDNIHAISNGVDLDYFCPEAGGQRSEVRGQKSEGQSAIRNPQSTPPLSLVFVGVLDYRANLEGLAWFCRKVWPLVRERIPQAKLTLVGRRPGEAARRLAEIDGVHLAGEVPDVRPHVWNSDVVIAPLTIARGIQNKVLEALAMAKPVVATPQAIEGTEARDGEHLLAAATPPEWAAALADLAENPATRTRLSAAGRSLIETRYAWSARLQPLADLLGLEQPTTAAPLAAAPRQELSLTA